MDTIKDGKNSNPMDDALEAVDGFAGDLDPEAARYWILHRSRFRWLAEFSRDSLSGSENPRILDIGNSFQTVLLKKVLPYSQMDTMGFFDHRFPAGDNSSHLEMDLNDAYYPEKWPVVPRNGYDLILFAEVLEHLYTSPEQVLNCLKSLLNVGGKILVQTPNAAALKKRIKLFFGNNPYELIRSDRGNPGHFRELTVQDLRRYAKLCGLEVRGVWLDSYLVDGKKMDRFLDRMSRYLPSKFKGGISICLQKTSS